VKTYDTNGDEVTAEDVLTGDELGEYRREHPRPPVHQMQPFPEPEEACDECGARLQPDDGALCIYCALRYDEDRNS